MGIEWAAMGRAMGTLLAEEIELAVDAHAQKEGGPTLVTDTKDSHFETTRRLV